MRGQVSRWFLAAGLVAWFVVLYVSVFRLMGKPPWPFRAEDEGPVQVLRGLALIVGLLFGLHASQVQRAAERERAADEKEPPKIVTSPTACYSCGKELAENERAARVCRACSA
jgi:hypothetical protein